MWCCWISPDDNPASTQRLSRGAPKYRAEQVIRAKARVSIRLMASTRQRYGVEPTHDCRDIKGRSVVSVCFVEPDLDCLGQMHPSAGLIKSLVMGIPKLGTVVGVTSR